MIRTRFTGLVGCSVPIQQAGMGAVAGPELAAAVTESGALGMLAQPMVPPEALAAMLDAVRTRTTAPVGVNFLMPFLDPACVEVAAAHAKVVEFFYDEPQPALVDKVHALGALAAWQVGSVQEAKAAANAGCDFVIAQGTEAGGHVRGGLSLLPLLDGVLASVDVPVVAAGGLTTARHVAAVIAAGADAARIGTRFLAAHEADVHEAYLDAVLAARGEDTVLTEAFNVMWPNAPHRVLRSCVERARSAQGDVVAEIAIGGQTMPVPRLSPMAATRATSGAIEAMALYAGEGVGEVRRAQPAAEIVRELAEGAEALLRRAAGG